VLTKLSSEQRQFFQLVAAAAFSNPFGQERDELDQRIAAYAAKSKPQPGQKLLATVKAAVAAHVGELGSSGGPILGRLGEADREIVKAAGLFHLFHRYEERLDELIRAQMGAGDSDVPAPFTADVLQDLVALGLPAEEAERYVGIFYQLRRAWHFIGTSLTGRSPCMIALRRHLWNNVFTFNSPWYERFLCQRLEDFSTLLLGETGTGKGAIAAALGRSGYIPYDRAKKRFKESFTRAFIAINLSQYPDTLIESELFGHKKGAFTGAVDNHAGVFARCSPHGAIFVDEVGDVSKETQVKLLGVLQERAFSPVGSHERQRFSGRVIAATNRDVDALRRSGQFRDDFYYRLCSDVIHVPPLRQRLAESESELGELLQHVLRGTLGEAGAELLPTIQEYVRRDLPRGYPWPGNVRELEQCVRRILLTGRYTGDLRRHRDTETGAGRADQGSRLRTAQDVMSDYIRDLYQRLGTYEEVARVAGLDRRTVKKHLQHEASPP
jgi:DNA-binding NtrC family response regulator